MREAVVPLGVLAPGAKYLAYAILFATALAMPPIPELPATGWPSPVVAEPFARELMANMPAESLDAYLAKHPAAIPPVFRNLGTALMTRDGALRAKLERYLSEVTRTHARREKDVRVLVSLQLVDPIRFLEDDAFRARVTPLLPLALDGTVDASLRSACLRELNDAIGLDFNTAERVARAWGSIPHTSADRRIAFSGNVKMPDDLSGPIEASIYSINSDFFTVDDARNFLSAVRKAAPKRKILVLADAPMKDALKGVEAIETFSRPYTPWPRDPFTVGRREKEIVFVNRPNLQPEREEDANMVRALVQQLDAKWTVAPVPFHNGHVLLTPHAAWISIHAVEIRALQLLRLPAVPVETFGDPRAIEAYMGAVSHAARELEQLYGRPVRYVHPVNPDPELFEQLAGGAGFDLDSVLTLLPQKDGTLAALVGDMTLGAEIARQADWSRASHAYAITATGAELAEAQNAPRAKALGTYLDVVATSLASRNVKVTRIPLIQVPNNPKDYLLTWNNVVLESNGRTRRAEGFASLLPEGDAIARDAFSKAGYELTLFPPLARSVVLSGGYRCASNHVRP